ncbi:MAG TPA: DnaJ domain-containing protein [Pyrinomonadaceae bacterium]|nr:DnaJ domain-containing protein [Pyrinomonadaceae bacterium]
MNGQLHDHPLAELIREISAERLSGALRLARERVKVVLYFDSGALVSARSNLRAHRLADSLKRWNVVEPHSLDALLTESMTDEEAGAALIAASLLGRDELDKLRVRQSADVLRPPLLWTEGEWSFDPHSRTDGNAHAALDAGQLLIEAVRRLPANFVDGRLTDAEEMLSPANTQASDGRQLQPAEAFVLSRLEAPLPIRDLVAISGVSESEARRIAYALALGGFLARAEWPRALMPRGIAGEERSPRRVDSATQSKTTAPEPSPVGVTRGNTPSDTAHDPQAELKALFAHAVGGTHYEVLGIGRLAEPADIKRSYHTLAKRFHPDRFHRGVDDSLRSRIEHAFTKISQAYEVLADAGTRAAYDLTLNAGTTQTAANNASHTASTNGSESSAGNTPTTSQRSTEESFQRGLAALRQGDHLRAAEHLGKAARMEPNQPRYRAHYGQALSTVVATRRQAEVELQAAIALDPRNAGYRVMLAELYRSIGLQRKAIAELERALAADSQHPDARRLLNDLKKG